jgi:hypothetical protein
MIQSFSQPDLHVKDYWRGIVLFGRNVASYKSCLVALYWPDDPSPPGGSSAGERGLLA